MPLVEPVSIQLQSKQACMEEVEDDDAAPRPHYTWFVRHYLCPIGTPIWKGRTKFKMLLEQRTADGLQPCEPFVSKEEWQLVMWQMANVEETSMDEYLKLPIVSFRSASMSSLLSMIMIRFTREVISCFITTTCSWRKLTLVLVGHAKS